MDNLESMLYQLRLELVAVQARIAELVRHGLEQNIRVPRPVAAMRSLKKNSRLGALKALKPQPFDPRPKLT
jgi:hypothetical protein